MNNTEVNIKFNDTLDFILAKFGIDVNRISALGYGHYSQVFATNRGTVIKFTVDDKCKEYMDFCKKNAGNPLFVEVLNDFGVVAKVGDLDVYAFELPMYVNNEEALIYGGNAYDDSYEAFSNFKTRFYKFGRNEFMGRTRTKFSRFKGADGSFLSIETHTHANLDIMDNICKISLLFGVDFNELTDALNLLQKEFSGREDLFFDMHGGNWMCDPKTGHLKITDPIGSRVTVDKGFDGVSDGRKMISDIDKNIDPEKAELLSTYFSNGNKEIKMFADFFGSVCGHKRMWQDYEPKKEAMIKVVNKSTGKKFIKKSIEFKIPKEVNCFWDLGKPVEIDVQLMAVKSQRGWK